MLEIEYSSRIGLLCFLAFCLGAEASWKGSQDGAETVLSYVPVQQAAHAGMLVAPPMDKPMDKAAEIVAHHNGVADAVADAVDDLTKPGVTHDTRAADIANSQTPDAVVKAVSVPSQDEATKVEVDAVVPEAGLSNSQITSGVSPGLADPKSISEAQLTPSEIASDLKSAEGALAKVKAVQSSPTLSKMAYARSQLPHLEVAASSAAIESERLQNEVAEQQGIVQSLAAMIRERERRSAATQDVYQRAKKVLQSSQRLAAAPAAPPVPPAVAASTPYEAVHSGIADAVHTAVQQFESKAAKVMQQKLAAHDTEEATIQKQAWEIRSKKSYAAAILSEAKQSADGVLADAKKKAAMANEALALSNTNTRMLSKISGIAKKALGDIAAVDAAEDVQAI